VSGRRQHRVEEQLRRELAQMLIVGELRDPRLSPASAVSITGVEVSADLSVAHVYVDVLTGGSGQAADGKTSLQDVLAALRSGAGLLRHKLGERLRLRRTPELRFAYDESIGRGARVEAILAELRDQQHDEPAPESDTSDDG
jgi:ribosome-binding factor A